MTDLRYAFRTLSRTPGFAATAVAIFALSIGANSSIFTVANASLLRSLPYADPSRLILVTGSEPKRPEGWSTLSHPFFTLLRDHSGSYFGFAACVFETFSLTGHGEPQQVESARATWDFFPMLGVRLYAGRTFSPEEDKPGGAQVVILSYEFATRLFGNADSAVGKNITLDSRVWNVNGVLPPGFVFSLFGPRREIWAPRVIDLSVVTPQRIAVGGMYFSLIGRLRPDISHEQAGAELNVLYQQYKHDKPGNFDATLNLTMRASSFPEQLVAEIRPALLMLSGAVALVLLIVCANLAALMLSRALQRKKEFAVRSALGAQRLVLSRQLLIEAVIVGVIGGLLGIALGQVGARGFASLSPEAFQNADIHLDSRVLLFTIVISVLSGLLTGMAPVLQLSRVDLNSTLRDDGRASTGGRQRNRLRSLLVVAQVALSIVLLVGSGLLIRSFLRLRGTAPGFEPANILTMQVQLSAAKYKQPEQMIAFYRTMLDRVQHLPGVEHAAVSTALPVMATHITPALFEGQPAVTLGQRPLVNLLQVSPDYSKVMRIGLVSGRLFDEHDTADGRKVAMVNQTVVRQFWPHENPIGKTILLGTLVEPYQVSGVWTDSKNQGLTTAPLPEVALPYPQMPVAHQTLSVRTPLNPRSLEAALRAEIAKIDPDQPVTEVKTGDELLESLGAQPRFIAVLLSAFSAVAFILAVVGLYGLIAYSVTQRTQELGLRIALGAAGQDVVKLVMGQSLILIAVGVVTGVAGALAATRLTRSLLFNTDGADPIVYLLSGAIFTVVAMFASYLPARKASRIEPADALRMD